MGKDATTTRREIRENKWNFQAVACLLLSRDTLKVPELNLQPKDNRASSARSLDQRPLSRYYSQLELPVYLSASSFAASTTLGRRPLPSSPDLIAGKCVEGYDHEKLLFWTTSSALEHARIPHLTLNVKNAGLDRWHLKRCSSLSITVPSRSSMKRDYS